MKQTWVGFAATLLSASSLIPLVYATIIKKSTHSINYFYTGLGLLAQFFWVAYGLVNKDVPLIILACYLICVYLAITVAKFHYEKKGVDAHSQLKKKCT